MSTRENIFRLHNLDVRNIAQVLEKQKEEFIDVTITSPPYFDLKSYGYENQIGHGQKYEDYLNALKEIFKLVFLRTKESGSLWIIIDTFSKEGNFVNLPFDLSNKLASLFDKTETVNKSQGWKLTDLIIWKKDKTLPYSRRGSI